MFRVVLSDYGCEDGEPDYQSVPLHPFSKNYTFTQPSHAGIQVLTSGLSLYVV